MIIPITLINLLAISLTIALYMLYKKRKSEFAKWDYSRSQALIFMGIATAIFTFLNSTLFYLFSFSDGSSSGGSSISFFSNSGIWTSFLLISFSVFTGIVVLIKKFLPSASAFISKIEAEKENLSALNNELKKELSIRDSQLKTSNQKLLQSEKKFRMLIDESPAILISVNENRILTEVNSHGARLLGYDPAYLVGKPMTKIVSKKDEAQIASFHSQLMSKGAPKTQTEFRLQRKDELELWVKITGTRAFKQNGIHHILICQDISSLKALEDKLSFQANHDRLTGLLNRSALENHLEKRLNAKTDTKNPLAFLYIDVDQLKVVNDTCGHQAGDQLLKQLSLIFQDQLDENGILARIGGNEFVVVQENATRDSAIYLAELLRNAAEDFTFIWGRTGFRQSVSIGVTLSSQRTVNSSAVFCAADAACYAAKEAGRNRIVFMDEDPSETSDNRTEMRWVSRIQEAFIKNRFELYFQPIINLGAQKARYIHYEVLIRYIDDDRKPLSPATFLPAAERYGLSEQVDLWVLTTTLDFLSKHRDHTRALSCVSINLTSHSLANHRTRSAIRQLIGGIDFSTNKICFEITETNAIRNLSEVMEFINELKMLGCRFALDDFGTGFSSFGYLKNLDIDYIKIDGTFVRDVVCGGIDRAIVTAINTIGNEMGINIIAEYVENEHISNELIALNIPYGQGYGLAKPMPLNKIERFYSGSTESLAREIH